MADKTTIEQYEDLAAYLDVLRMSKADMEAEVIPPEVRAALDDIQAEMGPKIAEAETRLAELKALLESEARFIGDKIEGRNFQAIYYKPGKSITVKDALSLAASWDDKHPECAIALRSIITLGKDRVSVQPRKGGG
jgi:hypothetical protein